MHGRGEGKQKLKASEKSDVVVAVVKEASD